MKNKNIHVLPTDKPSRLLFDKEENQYLPLQKMEVLMNYQHLIENQHIYITSSDEEITEGDWFVGLADGSISPFIRQTDKSTVEINNWQLNKKGTSSNKKIILTTDQDLIKDGVQEIDDEFLEWFIKNPSCEWVEFEKEHDDTVPYLKMRYCKPYKIIIPKEEPKPHSFCETPEEKCTMIYCDENGCQNRKRELVEPKPKQETLEEAASRVLYNKYPYHPPQDGGYWKDMFKEGVKWQAERMYSEEDMKQAFFDGVRVTGEGYNGEYVSGNHPDIEVEFYESYTEWFNKIKKK